MWLGGAQVFLLCRVRKRTKRQICSIQQIQNKNVNPERMLSLIDQSIYCWIHADESKSKPNFHLGQTSQESPKMVKTKQTLIHTRRSSCDGNNNIPQKMSEAELKVAFPMFLTTWLPSENCAAFTFAICHVDGFPAEHLLETLAQITNKYMFNTCMLLLIKN